MSRELAEPTLDPRGFIGLSTALARLDNKPVNEDALAGYFLDRLKDSKTPQATRMLALRGVPANYKGLRLGLLTGLLENTDPAFRVEALRALRDRADPKAADAVRLLAGDAGQPGAVRAQAVVTLAAMNRLDRNFAIELAGGKRRCSPR